MRALLSLLLIFPAFARADVPVVATDIAPVHAMVSQVMKGVGEPILVIPAGASPHAYAMRPSEARALGSSDLVVWVGPALTPWLTGPLDTLAADARKLELMEVSGMQLLPFREGAGFDAHDHGGHEDHDAHKDDTHAEGAHDDGHEDHDDHAHEQATEWKGDHAGSDPHLWLNPLNGAVAMGAIAQTLAVMDPANAQTYFRNAEDGDKRLFLLAHQIEKIVSDLSDRPFIVFHDAFHYFEARFGLEAVGAVSTGDAAKPGAARIAELRGHIAQTGAVCAFAEPQMNTGLLTTVIEGLDTKLATLDPLGTGLTPGADLYPDLLMGMAKDMAACLTP